MSHHLHQVPESFRVVITDVQGSTEAIEAGRYKDVNALGVASIIALRNALRDLDVPYVFGGDGATLLVPESRLPEVDVALRGLKRIAREAYSLELRCARVAVRELRQAGHELLVGRYRMSPHVTLACFSGSGFSTAEQWAKSAERGPTFAVPEEGEAAADLEGFECRWEPAASRNGQMMSLLVVATASDKAERESCYGEVISKLEYFGISSDKPSLTEPQLRLQGSGGDFSTEARALSRRPQGPDHQKAAARAKRVAFAGRLLMKLGLSAGGFNGRTYRREVLQNTDFRKFDEALRMVVDVSPEQVTQLTAYLEAQYQARRLAYGIHLSESALITCMIRDYRGDHVHFVDGSDGGYALSAKQLKARLRALGA